MVPVEDRSAQTESAAVKAQPQVGTRIHRSI